MLATVIAVPVRPWLLLPVLQGASLTGEGQPEADAVYHSSRHDEDGRSVMGWFRGRAVAAATMARPWWCGGR
jgi:hypothetical protein